MNKEPKKLTVADYMNTKSNTISPSATVKDAINTMIEKKTNRLIVIDEKNHIIGMLSSWDIARYIVPDYLENDRSLAPFASPELFVNRVFEVANDSITNCMSGEVVTAKTDDTLIEAAIKLTKSSARLLPVVNNQNELIGYITRTHIKIAIGDILQGKQNGRPV